jgi:hypothetical protein
LSDAEQEARGARRSRHGEQDRSVPQRPGQPANAEDGDAGCGQPRPGDDNRVEQLMPSIGAAVAAGAVGGQLAA